MRIVGFSTLLMVGGVVALFSTGAFAQQTTVLKSQQPPTTGSIVTSQDEVQSIVGGWSAKNDILGKEVINDASPPETIGTVTDVIIARDAGIAYAVVEAGGFLGIGSKYILVGADDFSAPVAGKFVLPGLTKKAVEAAPAFQYAQ